jgi:hypothetical protein
VRALALLMLTACGVDAFMPEIPPDGDADPPADARGEDVLFEMKKDASAEAAPDAPADTSMCPYSGPAECALVVADYCKRVATNDGEACCVMGGGCPGWALTQAACKNYLAQNGFDCSSGKYNKPVCASSAMCITNLNADSCLHVSQSTGYNLANYTSFGCGGFWGQF